MGLLTYEFSEDVGRTKVFSSPKKSEKNQTKYCVTQPTKKKATKIKENKASFEMFWEAVIKERTSNVLQY